MNFYCKTCMLFFMMSAMLTQINAQDLKSLLKGVAQTVIGDKATTSSSIIGTWTYVSPDCQFESENFLAKAGGEVAAQKVEEQMQTVFEKVGISNCRYVFNEDSTYSYTIGKRTINGTYTFNSEEKTITMQGKLGLKTVAHVIVTGNSMSLLFKADKLMSVLKLMASATSKVNSTTSTVNAIAEQYDGMMLGFELTK